MPDESTDIIPASASPPAQIQPGGPAAIVQYAIEKGASPEQLRELLAIQREVERDEARKAFEAAFAAAKRETPVIHKTRRVAFSGTSYRHAELDTASKIISEWLAPFGLSFAWDIDDADPMIAVTCRLKHVAGHFEAVTMRSPEDKSGSKNQIQARASTVTYLERYTLFAVCGISATGDDNDGADAPKRTKPPADKTKPKGRTRTERKKSAAVERVKALFVRWRKATGSEPGDDERDVFIEFAATAAGVEAATLEDPENWPDDVFEKSAIRLDELEEGSADA